jgi:retron-type reverse transcriptase
VHRAWRQVRRNHGAPGVDGMTCEEFPTYARTHWQRIRQDLLDGKYRPSAVRRVEIPKPNGSGERKLGIPTVIDRVIQQAIAQVLTPIFDPELSESSFGFRPKRDESTLDSGALSFLNRRMRTRMSGGVGSGNRQSWRFLLARLYRPDPRVGESQPLPKYIIIYR